MYRHSARFFHEIYQVFAKKTKRLTTIDCAVFLPDRAGLTNRARMETIEKLHPT
jgi:hypothetical protein